MWWSLVLDIRYAAGDGGAGDGGTEGGLFSTLLTDLGQKVIRCGRKTSLKKNGGKTDMVERKHRGAHTWWNINLK